MCIIEQLCSQLQIIAMLLGFPALQYCIQPILKAKLYQMMEVEQPASGEVELLTSPLPHFAAAYLMPICCLLEFFWSPTNLLKPARRVYISAGLVGWIALRVVLMNSRVSAREGKRLKEGGLVPLQRQWAGRSAQGCSQSCVLWGAAGEEGLLITCKGSFDFFRQHASI